MYCENCGKPLEEHSQFCSRCGRPSPKNAHGQREPFEPTFIPVRLDDVLEGKWKLEKKIGEGGMGTVYLATDLQLDRPVAIKILASSLVGDQEVVTRFEREAKVTASLEHPNIVPVYAVGRYEGRPFMVMKKLEGETLASLIRKKGVLTLDETLGLFHQLAAGLDFIHAKGYVHRDIKAGNIFVGPDGHATILDFGILRPSKSAEALTRTGMVMGTPQYMSPEQALGARDVDHRADLYALAVVLFECLTGTLPFDGESELQLIQMQAHASPPDLLERAPWLSRAVADVVKRALAKRPEDRYASGEQLVMALEAAARESMPPKPSASGDPSTALSWRKQGLLGAGRSSNPALAVVSRGSNPSLPAPPRGSNPALVPPDLASSGRGSNPALAVPAVTVAARHTPQRPGSAGVLPADAVSPDSSPAGPDTAALARSIRPSRARFAAAMVVLIAAAAGGYVYFARASEAPPRPIDHPQVAIDLTDATDATDAGTGVAEETASEPVDAGELALLDGEPDGGEVPSHEAAAAKARLKKPKGRKNGWVSITTTAAGQPTWAVVKVNGIEKNTPTTIELPPGAHVLRVERTGYKPQRREIIVASGRTKVLQIALTPR